MVWPSVAYAQDSPEVEAMIERGIELRRQGADEQALAVFLQAEAKEPRSVRIMLHVATAAQAASKWVMAAAYLKKVSRYSNDPYYRRYRDAIAQVERAIAQRVGSFQALGEPEGATVTMDGREIGKLPMSTPVEMEAGTYTVEISLDGYYPFTRSITIGGGSLSREVIRLNELPEEEKLALARGQQPPREWYESSWLTWTLAGVGVLGAAAAGTAYVLREDEVDEWNSINCLNVDELNQRRDQVCANRRGDIRTLDSIMVAGGATAIAFGGLAVAQWLATGSSSSSGPADAAKRREPAKRASVQCAPGLGSVVCQGSF